VPHIFQAALPADFADPRQVAARKDRFVMLVLPHVLRVNEEIAAERQRLMRIRGAELSAEDRAWLSWIAERYGTEDVDELRRRIDIIPPSLALAQAAEESGWGSSRFAHQGNALFGQRTAGDEFGIVPMERAAAEGIRVRAYEDLGAAVRSYARNLNTHTAYVDFRDARASARTKGSTPSGHRLAETLLRYSERGEAYVNSLRAIIRMNRLEGFDAAKLGGSSI
jgi:Bax protein